MSTIIGRKLTVTVLEGKVLDLRDIQHENLGRTSKSTSDRVSRRCFKSHADIHAAVRLEDGRILCSAGFTAAGKQNECFSVEKSRQESKRSLRGDLKSPSLSGLRI